MRRVGHLNNVTCVHYLHEALRKLGAAAGLAPAAHRTLRLDVAYLQPVLYGGTVEVCLAAAEQEGSLLRRAVAFTVRGSGEPAATARIDEEVGEMTLSEAAALGSPVAPTGRGTPQTGSAEPQDGLPTGWPAAPDAIEPLPPLPAPPPGVFSQRRRVTWQDLDLDRCVPDATPLRFAGTCGMGVIAAHGWPAERTIAAGFAIILRRTRMLILEPALPDDELEIATWVSDVKRVSVNRHYTITRLADGARLARIDTPGVWVVLAMGRPIRVPPGLLADLALNVAAG